MSSDLKVIFIDIDNTLLDFDAYVKASLEKGFAKYNLIQFEPYMYDVFIRENNKLWARIEDGSLSFDELVKIRFNIIFSELNIDFDGPVFEKFFRNELRESAIIIDGALPLLERLSRHFILCTASNGPYEQQLHRLKLAGMDKYFTYNFISEKTGYSKPDPGFFDYAFNEINAKRDEKITPDMCLIIGDSLTSDIEGGRKSGIKTCYYMRKIRDLSGISIDYTVTSLSQIPDLLAVSS